MLEKRNRRIFSQAKSFLSPEKSDARLAEIADAQERFIVAAEANGIARHELAAALPGIERRNAWAFYVMFLVSLAASLYAAVAPRLGLLGQSGLGLLDYGLPWLFAAVLWLRAGLASLRLYQVRIRALVGWREWLRDPMAVLGVPPLRSRVAPLVWFLALFFGLSGAALAQGAPGGSPSTVMGVITAPISQTDLAFNWLQRLFPALADMVGGQASEADPLKPMLMLFNGLLLLVGMGLLMFHTLSATVYAAHSGRSIGQGKYHGLWSPLRILAGVTFLAPIKGYCAAQFLVLKVIVIGYSLANGMWVTYVDKMMSADMVSVPTGISVGPGRIAAMRVLEAEACAVTMMAHAGNFRTGPSNWNPLSLFNTGRPVASRPPAAGVPQQRTLARGSGIRQGLRATPEQRAQSGNNSPQIVPGAYHVWDYGTTCGSLRMGHPDRQSGRSPGEEAAFQAFQRAKIQAMSSLIEGVRNTQLPERFMSMVVASPGARPRGEINESGPWYALIAAGEAYDREIEEAGQELVRSLNDAGNTRIRQTASELGWASAGALNMALTRMASEASRYVHNANPEVTPPEVDGVSAEGTSATEGMRILRALMANLAAAQREMQGHNIARSEDVQSNRDHASGSAGMAWLRELSQRVAHGMVAHTNLDPLRPMASIQAVGNTALVAGELAFVAGAAAALASNTAVGKGFGLDGKFRFVSGIATPIVIGLLIFGALHVYVLPLIPYVIWFFAVIGVASMAVELMIAAPLAALQHIKADGEEFVEQKQQTFYLMAFNALMKPSLLLFGLALSSVMFVVMANFLNQTFGYAMVVSQGDSIVGPVGVVVMLCFSFYLHYQICVKSFSLITQVPAVVSNLIGAPDPQRDEHQQGDVIVAGVANLTRKGVTNTTHAAASRAKGSQQPGDKPSNGTAPGGNGGALNPASAKGGAAPAGKPKGNE